MEDELSPAEVGYMLGTLYGLILGMGGDDD